MIDFVCHCECHKDGYGCVRCLRDCQCSWNLQGDNCPECDEPLVAIGGSFPLKEHMVQDHPDLPLHPHRDGHMTMRDCDGKTPTVLPYQDKVLCQKCKTKCKC